MRHTHRSPDRRGVVLLVVIAMLALFAVVGLSFVFFAESEATSSRVNRQAVGWNDADVEPELLLNYFLGQLLFDTDSDQSAIRGHSLGRNMYGANPDNINSIPFTGVGRLKYPHPDGYQNHEHINYQTFAGVPRRDPDYYYTASGTRGRYVAPNGPWTYPDLDNVYLAAVNGSGEVLMPSMHRPYNADWASAAGRYKSLRPHLTVHPNFPQPEMDATGQIVGGDVKNLDNSPGLVYIDSAGARKHAYNDSYWTDLGFGVLTAADGTKYKPLFAALVMDLDNKINLNVAGNRLAGGAQGGHQGWGPWEINAGHVMTPTEANNILGYRYDTSNQPISPVWPNWSFDNDGTYQHVRARGYAPADFNAAATGPLVLPTGTAIYPTFPGYSAANIAGHPARYNPMRDETTGGSNKVIHPYHLEAVLRYQGAGSPALDSTLFRMAPFTSSSFRNTAGPRAHFMVTPFSFDSNRPGLSPWLQGNSMPNVPTNPSDPPTYAAEPFPDLAAFGGGSEFTADTRAVLAALGKVDLNRYLPPYPHLGAGTSAATHNQTAITAANARHDDTNASFSQMLEAKNARQKLANDIYRRMLALSGLPNVANPNAPDMNLEIKPRRFLAQIAVNIVDFLDEDDVISSFQFYGPEDGAPAFAGQFGPGDNTNATRKFPKYWVFGTEKPRVVLNEILNEFQLPAANGQFAVKFWAELKNPFPNGTENVHLYRDAAQAGGPSQLSDPYSTYEIVVAKNDQNPAPMTYPEGLKWHEHNVLGAPDWDDPKTAPQRIRVGWNNLQVATIANKGTPSVNAQLPGGGFMLVGPSDDDVNSTINSNMNATTSMPNIPGTTPYFQSDSMKFQVDFDAALNTWTFNGVDITTANPRVTVALRRLANPYLPHDNNPRDPGAGASQLNLRYNPFVTVDYVEVPLSEVTAGNLNNQARGRQQPMSSQGLGTQALNPAPAVGVVTTQHTLGADNSNNAGNYDWMPHLDRRVISPAELFLVSMYKPHQLTRKFIDANGSNRHLRTPTDVPYWTDPSLRLSRFFELATVAPRMAGLQQNFSGRIPGKININTIYDQQVLLALLDPQAANGFNSGDVNTAFADIVRLRNSSSGPGNIRFGPNDRPFHGMGVGEMAGGSAQYPAGLSPTSHSLLRDSVSTPGQKLFELADPHPYKKWEMLNKVFNNLTTRSNTFALFLTVGFFEVTQDSGGSWTLGREVGKDQGRNVRRRMFALIDRTSLVIPAVPNVRGAAGALQVQDPVGPDPANPTGPVTLTVTGGPASWPLTMNLPPPYEASYRWTPRAGMDMQIIGTINGQPASEPIVLQAATAPSAGTFTITTQMKKMFDAGSAVLAFPGEYGSVGGQHFVYGNPGPQQRFNAVKAPNLVPYFSVIH